MEYEDLYVKQEQGIYENVDELIAEADDSEDRALNIIDRLTGVMEINVVDDPRDAKGRYLETHAEIDTANKELESAITSMQDLQGLKVPVWQKNYADLRIQSLSRRIKMLDSLKRWFSRMELVADFLQRTTLAQQKFNNGINKINESIENSNNKNYDRAKVSASNGKQLFDESQKLLQEADKIEKDADLESVMAIVYKAQDFASLTIQLAEAGAAERIDEYNDIAQRSEDSKADVVKDWSAESIVEAKKWYSKKTKKLESSINNYRLEAMELEESASLLYKKNTK